MFWHILANSEIFFLERPSKFGGDVGAVYAHGGLFPVLYAYAHRVEDFVEVWAVVGIDSETLLDQGFQLGSVPVLALAEFCAVVEFEALCVGVNVYVVHKLK
jgi:hypothetical protein